MSRSQPEHETSQPPISSESDITSAATAGIVGAVPAAGLVEFGASMPRSRMRSAPSVMESPSLTVTRPSTLRVPAVEPCASRIRRPRDRDGENQSHALRHGLRAGRPDADSAALLAERASQHQRQTIS